MGAATDAPCRLIAASSAMAALCGVIVGSLALSDISLPARLFYGGIGGLLVGGFIGAVAALTGLLAAILLRAFGARSVGIQRAAFVVAGGATALSAAWWGRSPMTSPAQVALMVSLAVVSLGVGTLLGRRYIGGRRPTTRAALDRYSSWCPIVSR